MYNDCNCPECQAFYAKRDALATDVEKAQANVEYCIAKIGLTSDDVPDSNKFYLLGYFLASKDSNKPLMALFTEAGELLMARHTPAKAPNTPEIFKKITIH